MVFQYQPESRESNGGQRLMRRADFQVWRSQGGTKGTKVGAKGHEETDAQGDSARHDELETC